MRRAGTWLAIASVGAVLAGCHSSPTAAPPKALAFTFTVSAASWSSIQSYVKSSANGGSVTSAEDFLRTYLCEDSGTYEAPKPTIASQTSTTATLHVSLTSKQVQEGNAGLKTDQCVSTYGIHTIEQDYKYSAMPNEITGILQTDEQASPSATTTTPPTTTTAPATTTTAPPTTSPLTTVVGGNLTGMGELQSKWNATHQKQSGPGGNYGAQVPDGTGGFQPEWGQVLFGDGRVTAFTLELYPPTSLAEAKQDVMEQIPPDSVTTLFQVIHDSSGNSCAFWNLQSPTLAKVIGPPPAGDTNGDIGVDLYTNGPNATIAYDPSNLNVADVSLAPADPSNSC